MPYSLLPLANCRFCKASMTYIHGYPDFRKGKTDAYYEFQCEPCKSTQFVDSDNKPMHYWFIIGKYKLYFMPFTYSTPVFQLCNGNLGAIFELKYLPNFTPQNMTEERIRTLILFS